MKGWLTYHRNECKDSQDFLSTHLGKRMRVSWFVGRQLQLGRLKQELFYCCVWKVRVLVAQSCPTLCDPMGCSLPGSSAHGILQARILECVAIPFSRGSCCPRHQTLVSSVAGRFFTIWVNREAPWVIHNKFSVNKVEYFEIYIKTNLKKLGAPCGLGSLLSLGGSASDTLWQQW